MVRKNILIRNDIVNFDLFYLFKYENQLFSALNSMLGSAWNAWARPDLSGVRSGPSGSIRVRPGPSGSVRVCPGPSGSVRIRPGLSGSVRVRPGLSGSVRVRPGPSRSIQARPGSSGSVQVHELGVNWE